MICIPVLEQNFRREPWYYLPKIKMCMPFGPEIPFLGIIHPSEIFTHIHTNLCIVNNVYCTIVYNGEK